MPSSVVDKEGAARREMAVAQCRQRVGPSYRTVFSLEILIEEMIISVPIAGL